LIRIKINEIEEDDANLDTVHNAQIIKVLERREGREKEDRVCVGLYLIILGINTVFIYNTMGK